MTSFGSRLKKRRKELGYNQQDLAEKLKVGQTTIANYETDKRFPKEDMLIDLADLLDISIDYLLGRSNKQKPLALSKSQLQDHQTFFMDKMLLGEEEEAVELMLSLAYAGFDVLEIYDYFLKPTMYKVGDLWAQGKLSIAKEHHISAVIDQAIQLLSSHVSYEDKNGKKIALLTPTSEQHNLGLKIVAETFKKHGWKVYFLGGNLPIYSILSLLKEEDIHYLGLSITTKDNINVAEHLLHALRRELDITIILGGQALIDYEEEAMALAPDYYVDSENALLEIIQKIEKSQP